MRILHFMRADRVGASALKHGCRQPIFKGKPRKLALPIQAIAKATDTGCSLRSVSLKDQ
jgi:hypothetical protein